MSIQTESSSRKSWRDSFPIHPAADLLPPMSADELRELGKDVVDNSLKLPIVLWRPHPKGEALLLDGRNRLDAIELATGKKVEVGAPSIMAGEFLATDKVIVLDGRVDPYSYVMSVNIYRRDLGVEERQNALIKLIARTPEKSDRQIAKEICVDHKTIARARAKGEATGAVAPVEKRVGGDGKARKQPTRNRETKKEEEERFKRRAAETRAQMAEGRAAHEFGKNEQLQARIDDLTSKNSALKAELAKTKDELAKVKAELDEIIAAQVDDGARNARGNRSRVAGRQRRARRQCQ